MMKKREDIVFTPRNHDGPTKSREPALNINDESNTSPNLTTVQGREGLGFRVRQLCFWTCMSRAPAETKCLFLSARFQSSPI